jgi:hypothetical protein
LIVTSATSIRIGGTFPLSGFASIYAPIPRGMEAYFKYVNSRRGPDGKRGVYGRRIVLREGDGVFADIDPQHLRQQQIM